MSELEPTLTYSNPTATDELLTLLKEHGVEHYEHEAPAADCVAFFDGNGWHDCWDSVGEEINVTFSMTPEQVIAATLGSCNCSDNCTNSERTETCEMEYVSDWMSWHCKSCDHMDMAPRNPKPRYCKWCGRKVVD